MNIVPLLKSLPEPLQTQLCSAIQAGALIHRIGDSLYAARWDGIGWWTWKLEPGSQEYFVDAALTYCTCKADPPCKHLLAIKHGGDA